METHPDPDQAMSDGPNAWPLPQLAGLLEQLRDLDALIKQRGMA
jgi:2-dehydro-3-deoxyphosphooctonate aldolase (KDO 8-P synthase)